ARGKQTIGGKGIWYTPSSGIWQTVWLESVPLVHLEKIKITPDIDNSAVSIRVFANAQPKRAEIIIFDGDEVVSKADYIIGEDKTISLPQQKLWSPENPHLYDVVVACDDDLVRSYFGQRKFSIDKDKNGRMRMFLNNKAYFHNGLLDQGYWCDGMYTAPSDEAMIYDIKLAKDLGFNMLRKHIKIEPFRWYYHCDRLGIIVWQDMINGGSRYKLLRISALPFLGAKCDDTNYKKLFRESEDGRAEFISDYTEMLSNLYNVVSIGVWVIFNEAWGQFDSVKITALTKKLDNTRVIDSTSGWYDQGGGDVKSIHCYFVPFKLPKAEKRAILLSEFGGYSYQEKGH
ncbi:MAG: glycoside hydrolase family 2 TIM barrel-domain containing protein, partial [Clostridia bacterium]